MSYQNTARSMGQADHGGLSVFPEAHDLRAHSVEARVAAGHMVNQAGSVFINCNLDVQDNQPVGTLAIPSRENTRTDHASPPQPAVDRESAEWARFVRGILGRLLGAFQLRTNSPPVFESSRTQPTGDQATTGPNAYISAPLGNPDYPPATASRTSISKGEAYVISMLSSGKGLACWQPRPRHPIKDGQGVVPGDVGLFSVQEGFQKVFNLWDDEEAIHRTGAARANGTPYAIPTKGPNIVNNREHLEGETVVQGATAETLFHLDNETVAGFEFRYQEPYRRGAILAITSSTMLEKLTAVEHTMLEEHVTQHAELIYTYATTLQRIPDDQGLYIITGCMKSEDWAIAGFIDPMTPPGNVLRLIRRSPPANSRKGMPGLPPYVWTAKGTADGYSGASQEAGSQDQCLFLKGFKLDFSQPFRSRVRHHGTSSAGSSGSEFGDASSSGPPQNDGHHPKQGPDNGNMGSRDRQSPSTLGSAGGTRPSDGDLHVTGFPTDSNSNPYHPCDAINKYLLETTGSDFALSHDDDWIPVLRGDSHPNRAGDSEDTGFGSVEGSIHSHRISTTGGVSALARHGHSQGRTGDERTVGGSECGPSTLTECVTSDDQAVERRHQSRSKGVLKKVPSAQFTQGFALSTTTDVRAMTSSSSVTYTLLQYGDDPFKHSFADLQGNVAFTINEAMRDPNKIIRLIREEPWAAAHSSYIMGPDKSYFFFGAEERPGYVVYGNSQIKISMEFFLRPGKKEGSTSRYFQTQTGQHFKWNIISTHKMECQDDKHRRLAVWEVSPPDEENFGRLVLGHASLAMVTEILTSLTLNRMAQALGW